MSEEPATEDRETEAIGIDEEQVLVERNGSVTVISLNRPGDDHALTPELVDQLSKAIETAGADGTRVVVLTGTGDQVFCSGADMKRLGGLDTLELQRAMSETRRLFRLTAELPVPTIAALNGHTHGGGAELACACDLRIGCERTTFRFPGVQYGLAVGTWHLPSVVGLPKAKELLFTTNVVGASEALRIGLLNQLTGSAKLLDLTLEIAQRIAEQPENAVRNVKDLLTRGVGVPLQARFYRELYSNNERNASEEAQAHFQRFSQSDDEPV